MQVARGPGSCKKVGSFVCEMCDKELVLQVCSKSRSTFVNNHQFVKQKWGEISENSGFYRYSVKVGHFL